MPSVTPSEKFKSAQQAFEHTKRLSVQQRVNALKRTQRLLVEQMDDIVAVVCRETGKPADEALMSDVFPCLDAVDWYAKHLPRLQAERKAALSGFFSGSFARVQLRPSGPALVVSPWNFPFQLTFLPTLAAVCAGNSVLLKPSPLTPQTAHYVARLFEQAGFAPNAVQTIAGGAQTVQELIALRPARVFFTGGTSAGRQIAVACAEKLIPCLLELGGKAPAIILPGANLARAAKGVAYGAFVNRGQVCTAVTRILVHQSVKAEFLRLLTQETSLLKEGRDYGPLLQPERLETLKEWVRLALQGGAVCVSGDPAFPQNPLILDGVTPDMTLFNEECFAPVLSVTTFDSAAQAAELANHSAYGLSASIWGPNNPALETAHEIRAGHISVNDAVKGVGAAGLAFGGLKDSGWGRYHGADGFDFFCDKISLFVNRSARSRQPHWFPRDAQLYRHLKTLLQAFYAGRWLNSGLLSAFRALYNGSKK